MDFNINATRADPPRIVPPISQRAMETIRMQLSLITRWQGSKALETTPLTTRVAPRIAVTPPESQRRNTTTCLEGSRMWPRALLASAFALSSVCHAAAPVAGDHLSVARELVSNIDLRNTSYEHGQGTVSWTGTLSSNTDCSGFVDHLLMHTYHYGPDDFSRWFGTRRPSAKRYYDAIIEQTGFRRIDRVTDLKPGDFIAVKYLARTDNTGHIMLVDQPPQRAGRDAQSSRDAVAPGDAWLVPVIDSSETGHGPTDTRHKRGADGHDHDGLGRGVLRLYTDRDGRVIGFSWSALKSSEFRGPDTEPVALGRLVPGYNPE
jgi:hypothetical protein